MALYKRRTYSGAVLEQEVYNVASNTKNLKRTEPKPPMKQTEDQRQRHLDLAARRQFTRIVNTNFGPQSFYVTLTMDDAHVVDNFDEAAAIMVNYYRRLQYSCPDMVAVSVMGRGITTDRIHWHLIIKNVDEKTISDKWKAGSIKRIEHLREHNFYEGIDHGKDYTGLAHYMFSHWTPEQGSHRWKQTKNIKQPEKETPVPIRRTYSEVRPPRAPKGYKLVESRSTDYGYLYFKYVKIIDGKSPVMRC